MLAAWSSQPVAATRDARGGRVVAKADVAQLRTKFNQLCGAAPGSASASQPDQLTLRPQVLIGFCCHKNPSELMRLLKILFVGSES